MENIEKFNGWESEEWRKYWGVDDCDDSEDDPIEEM